MDIIRIPLEDLTPDPSNAKDHPAWQIEQIKNSIEAFGNLDPIGVWGEDNLIVEGHGRYEALKELGYTEAECIRLDWLTDEERRAYALAHNKLTMNSGFIPEALDLNLDAIGEIDMSLFGFDSLAEWFGTGDRGEAREGEEEYSEFLEKFEAKHTTDDCYTPERIYEAVAGWVEKEYNVKRKDFVRPFYPGGDYQNEKYPKGCVVVDNPPFSILAEILNWYKGHGVRFFLFAPSLTLFSSSSSAAICTGSNVTYANGANVSTAFLTNLEPENVRFRTAPDLYQLLRVADEEERREQRTELPKYSYPPEVVTSHMMAQLSKYGQDFVVLRSESEQISALDSQREAGKAIYGKGYLISEKAAAEKAAAEKAAAEKAAAEKAAAEKAAAEKTAAMRWKLSDRELAIIEKLGRADHGD